MPSLTLPQSGTGCVVELWIGVSEPRIGALVEAGQPIPNPIRVPALIDTGATNTVVDTTMLDPLGLMPTGTVPVHALTTDGEAVPCLQYDAQLRIRHPEGDLLIGSIPIIASNLAAAGTQALVGLDLLEECRFTYDGPTHTFTLAWGRVR